MINKYKTQVLAKVNKVLSLILILLGTFIMFYPYLPEIQFQVIQATNSKSGFVFQSKLAADQQGESFNDQLQTIPTDQSYLVIPGIYVNGPIVEGYDKSALSKGLWRRPNSSTPELGGNTVIVAHRFRYTSGPITFYHLDKMQVGDKFSIFWNGAEYDYEVFDVLIVPPTAVEIEENTNEPIVTLYTCTPLFTAENRLVVKARLI